MENDWISTLFLHDMFSPLPLPEGWGILNIDDIRSKEEVELYDTLGKYWDGEDYRISTGERWLVTKGAIAKAYREEMTRIIRLANQIAPHVVLYMPSSNSLLDIKGLVVYKRDHVDTSEETDLFSRKVSRLLRQAVELSGKNPNPFGPMIFHRKYWHGRLHTMLDGLLEVHSNQLTWIASEFIPVLSAALKEHYTAPEATGRTLVFRCWVRSVADIPGLLFHIREFINQHKANWSLEIYREVATFLDQLNGDTATRNEGQEMKALFFQPSPNTSFLPLCIGMAMPGPEGGYPIELANGEVVQIARPPWNSGHIINPRRDET